MTGIVVFAFSLALLFLLFGVKHWERSGGRVLFQEHRARADAFAAAQARVLVRDVPVESREALLHVLQLLAHKAVLGALCALRVAERRFERLADSITGRRTVKKKGSVSLFLRSVAEHKRTLEQEQR